jgi:hypothetical protein
MLDLRTPSSPHSTSSSMTSASPIAPKSSYAPAPIPPFPQARSSPSPSSPDGRDSPASETSTATPRAICQRRVPHPARALFKFNRLVRFHAAAIEEIALHLAQMIEGERCLYQALDASAMPVRDMPSVVAMAGFCRTGRHRLVQQPGLVGGFLFAHCG